MFTLQASKQHGVFAPEPIAFDRAQITSNVNRTRAEPGLPASTLSAGSQLHAAIPVAEDWPVEENASTGQGWWNAGLGTLSQRDYKSANNLVTHSLTSAGADASEDGTGRGTPLAVFPVMQPDPETAHTLTTCYGKQVDTAGTNGTGPKNVVVDFEAQGVALRGRDGGATAELSGPISAALRASQGGGDKAHALTRWGVRRLTPVECERLMGFPDSWTQYRDDGREISDSARYRMLGNSVAVPVVERLAKRIYTVLEGGEMRIGWGDESPQLFDEPVEEVEHNQELMDRLLDEATAYADYQMTLWGDEMPEDIVAAAGGQPW